MKERPILFSAPMVRALLEGRKTQTRRVVKSPSNIVDDQVHKVVSAPHYEHGMPGQFVALNAIGGIASKAFSPLSFSCPYGVPGDRLWVRETIWHHARNGRGLPDHDCGGWCYAANGSPESGWKRISSIHMPRWASRLTLEITNIRVERVQEISEEDARAEGVLGESVECDVAADPPGQIAFVTRYRQPYMRLWDSINGVGSWVSDPWVWAITFKAVKP